MSQTAPTRTIEGIDLPPADSLIGAEQIVVGAEAADRKLTAKPPRAHAQVSEILAGVASVNELPVEYPTDAGFSDDRRGA